MATVREFITKLTTKADLSGAKKTLSSIRKMGQEVLKSDTRSRASSKRTTRVKTKQAVIAMREQIKAMKNAHKAQRRIDKAALKQTRNTAKATIRAAREVAREKIKQMNRANKVSRQQARRGRGGGGNLRGGASGVGMGSIISGNVIANAITAGFRSAANAVKDFAVGMIDAAANIEKVKAEFGVMLDSGDRALELVASLKKKGAETPLQFKDLAKNARILLQYGSSAENVVDQLTMIGDVVGGDRARFDFMSFAFAQMRSAGKLMGQELRQMVNAGFNPLEQMMKTTGLTMNELRKEMEMGTISSDDVTDAFKQATSKGGRFFNNMAVQAKTFTGRVSTMRDEIFMMMEAMGTRLLPGMKKAVNKIIKFIKGAGRKIGVNLMDSMLPAVNAIIRGVERFTRVMFDIDKIGGILQNKESLTKFFEDLAEKIDKVAIFITASALSMKEFFIEVAPAIAEAFGIMVWGIKTAIRHLPTLIKLYAGFKALQLAMFFGSLAVAISSVVKALLGFAVANAPLAAAVALLVGMGIALDDVLKNVNQIAKAQEFNDATKQERAAYTAKQAQIDKELAAANKINDLTKSTFDLSDPANAGRAKAHDDELLARGKHIQLLIKQRDALSAGIVAKKKAIFGDERSSLLDQITGVIEGFMGIGTATGGTSFDKKLEDVRKTQVIQNFFIQTDVETNIQQNIPEGRDSEDIGATGGEFVGKKIKGALDDSFRQLRAASAS